MLGLPPSSFVMSHIENRVPYVAPMLCIELGVRHAPNTAWKLTYRQRPAAKLPSLSTEQKDRSWTPTEHKAPQVRPDSSVSSYPAHFRRDPTSSQ